ncbi:hypothetical protein MAIT1_02911 [Magnetofaba australis IT-1]|uniref:Uncharacterized protein n=1 Tax=Magnetofaba australis IT-1 TaxID=1434232 RepID=A0A1Y2K7R5_9PROT|nr:hypothetical protein MAIT1_02911 [Magnetofaba australis IT-1]
MRAIGALGAQQARRGVAGGQAPGLRPAPVGTVRRHHRWAFGNPRLTGALGAAFEPPDHAITARLSLQRQQRPIGRGGGGGLRVRRPADKQSDAQRHNDSHDGTQHASCAPTYHNDFSMILRQDGSKLSFLVKKIKPTWAPRAGQADHLSAPNRRQKSCAQAQTPIRQQLSQPPREETPPRHERRRRLP